MEKNPAGVLVAVHGLGDHVGRYEFLAQMLTARGWALVAFDLPGHGKSPGVRGHIDRYDGWLADIASASRMTSEQLPGASQVICGHSMGGNLALNYVMRRAEFDDSPEPIGLALLSPMILPANPPQRPHVFAAWLTGILFPWFRFGRSVPTDQLTRDAAAAESLAADELTHSKISVRLATQLLAQGRWALDHAREIDVPTLIMYGDADQLIDQGACEHLAVRIGNAAHHVVLPRVRHDIFHDHDHDQAMEHLVDWLAGVRQTP